MSAQTGERQARSRPLRVQDAIRAEVVEVTPELAEKWLGKNSHNRGLANGKVAEYKGMLDRGEWLLNGEAIKWSIDDVLLDGQHRLWAVIESGVPMWTLVVYGLPNDNEYEVQETMDRGRGRTFSDALKLRGESNHGTLAAVVVYFWRYINALVRTPGKKPSVAQGLALLKEHPNLREAARRAGAVNRRFRISQAMVATCWYEFDSIDAEANDVFWQRLLDGLNLTAHDPIYILRKYLENQAAIGSGARSEAVVNHALIIKAWNAYRDGVEIERLSWKSSGMKAEPFPEPH